MTAVLHPETAVVPPAPVLGGVDHVEWWVGNARTFAGFLASTLGFDIVAYAGPETGRTDGTVSYLLRQGRVEFVVTGALHPDSPVAAHVRQHGDGVRDVAFAVSDLAAAHDALLARGATEARSPEGVADGDGEYRTSAIEAYGDTLHSLVDRSDYRGAFAPGFEATDLVAPVGPTVGITRFDHIVANVEKGNLSEWVDFYRDVFGFDQLLHFDDDQISTEYSALMSTVVWNGSRVVLPINEPADGRKKSQIEEYLDFYRSPGVQHIALHTDDILTTVRALRARGLRFLDVPAAYYDEARERLTGIDLPWEALAELGILVDRDHDGHLLQIFTETVTDRPTVFFEIIQRAGARGFGEGNFKALFEAIERAQARRGNL